MYTMTGKCNECIVILKRQNAIVDRFLDRMLDRILKDPELKDEEKKRIKEIKENKNKIKF